MVEAGQTYAADEESVCAKKSKSKKRPRIKPLVISFTSADQGDACHEGWWVQEEIGSEKYLFWGSGDHATPADVPRGRWRKYDQLRRRTSSLSCFRW